MKRIALFLFAGIIHSIALSQIKNYYVGHSLVNLNMPYQVKDISLQEGVANMYRHHINIGTALQQNWTDTTFNINAIWDPDLGYDVEHGTNHLVELLNPYDNILLTEAVPLLNYDRDTTVKYASNFVELALGANPNIQPYIYATWEGDAANGASWRNNLEMLVPEWESIADEVAFETGVEDVFIIPGNLAMIALYDSLENGPIGSFTSITDFFESDGIHLTFNGNFFIACLTSAILNEINPIGNDAVEAGPYTDDFVVLDDVARMKLQEIAIAVACEYAARTGYTSACNSPLNIEKKTTELSITIFPNPGFDLFTISTDTTIKSVEVYDNTGKKINAIVHNHLIIDLSDCASGSYLVSIETDQGKKVFKQLVKR